MEVPPNHPFLTGFPMIDHPFSGTPTDWKPEKIYPNLKAVIRPLHPVDVSSEVALCAGLATNLGSRRQR